MLCQKTLANLSSSDLAGKRVLVRADFNVPLNEHLMITDDTRIRAALPTIRDLTSKGAKVILCSHFGRPKGVDEFLRLTPVAARLSELLGQEVLKCDDCIGDRVVAQNGPMGVFEFDRFAVGTEAIAKSLANLTQKGACTIIGAEIPWRRSRKSALPSK